MMVMVVVGGGQFWLSLDAAHPLSERETLAERLSSRLIPLSLVSQLVERDKFLFYSRVSRGALRRGRPS